ncbi:multiple sugar transport system permease protein [Paenibacillus sp. V4I3]|uniref:carbohydrate ABC transporter permease n=1 Tax=Paenibacillus sp. V4I3 TaxID=3042305 RepID=UPI00278556DC|nr:sugar ABC transporter permease [Paenibacillus sp. V4I3]MDQ0877561.1 multiple sugar transport system permease protein [Paenibacillus sp. V4I3]
MRTNEVDLNKTSVTARSQTKTRQWRLDILAFLFLLPFLAVYVVFSIFPMIKGLQMSLYDWTLIKKMDFVGLNNYIAMVQDANFWRALWNSTYFVILSTPSMLIFALLLAVIANQKTRLQKFFRSVFFLPSVLSVSVVSYVGLFVIQPYTGFLNNLLKLVGILSVDQEIFWLTESSLAWIAITAITLWWTVGVNMILYLSAMQDIPDDIYEAGRLDGASERQMFFRITLPLLGPITKTILLLQIIASYKVFLQIYIITRGGPGTDTRPIIQYIYEEGIKNNHMGYAATMSYALFAILLVLSLTQLKMSAKKEAV